MENNFINVTLSKNIFMRKLLSICLIGSALLQSCEKTPDTQIKGTADDLSDGTNIYLSKLGKSQNIQAVDTFHVKQNSFVSELPTPNYQDIFLLSVEGLDRQNLIFINEGHDVEVELNKSNLRDSKITGGPQTDQMTKYLDKQMSFATKANDLQGEIKQAKAQNNKEKFSQKVAKFNKLKEENLAYRKELVKTSPNSIVSLLIINDFLSQKSLPVEESKKLLATLNSEIRDTELGKSINKNLASIKATDIGAFAPKFEGPTPDGETLSLEDAMGKVTLIDFWASWCRPCRVENPNIVAIYNDYKDKGFDVIGVSLDKPNQKDRWLKAIKDDKLDWHHVSNLQFWNDPIAKLYGVRSIPRAYLIDEEGKIIAKNLRGQQLRDKVAELLD
jgi:peroxiredoxin